MENFFVSIQHCSRWLENVIWGTFFYWVCASVKCNEFVIINLLVIRCACTLWILRLWLCASGQLYVDIIQWSKWVSLRLLLTQLNCYWLWYSVRLINKAKNLVPAFCVAFHAWIDWSSQPKLRLWLWAHHIAKHIQYLMNAIANCEIN